MAQPFDVRPAAPADAAAIAAIYNEGVDDRVATFETAHRSTAGVRTWLRSAQPVVVAVSQGRVVGFARLSPHSDRDCYRGIAECSVYVARAARRRGAGRAALRGAIEAATRAGYWKLVSRIFVDNVASRRLVRSLGFREIGVHERHARLDGRWRDVVVVERSLHRDPSARSPHRSRTVHETSEAISAFARAFQLRDRNRVCRHGLTVSECYALEATAGSGGLGVVRLAHVLGVNKSSASRIADSLTAAGLVREKQAADGRSRLIVATRRGRSLNAAVHREIEAEHGRALSAFNEHVLEQCRDLLTAVAASRTPPRLRGRRMR